MRRLTVLLIGVLISTLSNVAYSQNGAKNTYVAPFKLTVSPSIFKKGQLITAMASFTLPASCLKSNIAKAGIVLRLYNIDDSSGEPDYKLNTQLVQVVGTLNPVPPVGTKVSVPFETFALSARAGPRIYLVVWRVCQIHEVVGGTPDGPIIDEEPNPVRMGGAIFKYTCPSPKELCAYRPE